MDEIMVTRGMTDNQRMMFMSEMSRRRKSTTTLVLLTLFLGGVGAHHFYLGNILLGVLYLLFFWTFIPGLIAFIELFFSAHRIRSYNDKLALEVATLVRAVG